MVMIESECKALKMQIQALEKIIQDHTSEIARLSGLNDDKDQQIALLQEKIHKDEQLRRKLHNEIQASIIVVIH